MAMDELPFDEMDFDEGIRFWVESESLDHPMSCQMISKSEKYLMLGLLPRGQEAEEILVKYPGQDALYFFRSFILIQSNASPGKFLWEVSKPPVVFRRQDRRFLRARLNFQVYILDDQGQEVEETVGMDISGGGMSMAVPDDLDIQMQDVFLFRLVFPTQEVIETPGKVVRVQHEEYHILSGIEFLDLSQTSQETLVRLAFQADWAHNVKNSQRF